jgi:two-component system, NtrC family, sensor histidine kinase HydH
MKIPQHIKRSKILVRTGIIVLLILIISLMVNISIEFFNRRLINENKGYTETTAILLVKSLSTLKDSLNLTRILLLDSLSNRERNIIDKTLSKVSQKEFSKLQGMEGGFFLIAIDEFIGYSYPSSPPPIPLFGPPPRSYQIIKNQILTSIRNKVVLTEFHTFDPAVFPLTTIPISIDGKVIGAAWTRVHIERDLPILRLKEVVNIAAAIAIIGFIIILFITVRLRRRIEDIKMGLEKVQIDSDYRLLDQPGMFSYISQSINRMVETLQEENRKRQELEKELHQQDKMASLGKLIAGVAHEVKTPLAIIKTRIQMWERELRKSGLTNSSTIISEDSIKLVVNEINRLSNLVKRLLIFSKPASDKFIRNNLNDFLQKTLTLIETDMSEKGITVKRSFDSNLPLIFFDPNTLEQVFINLYTNSIEAMPDGGEMIIATRADWVSNNAEIIIEDTGSGIPPEVKDKIFDPFFSTKQHGAGLGLSIAYEVITMHRGSIEFIQKRGNGTICKITLPIK